MAKEFPDIWELKKNKLDIAEFTCCIKECWKSLDQAVIDKLIVSITRRRLAAVKAARGG
ncbi:hypothetical protein F5883DRAFT_264874 [Diaporthe sp. PMI_573]|nr:hypothetical protein F5883DRAFT_264874 [Diaporthaceae sp. PMI_573]